MSGKNPKMTPLEARKRLLVAESELNRAQLIEEWRNMAGNFRLITGRAKSYSTLALAGASLLAGLMYFRRAKSAMTGQKSSWWQTLFKGAKVAFSLWSQFGHRPHRPEAN